MNICKSASWTIWEGKFQAARGPGCDWVRKQKGQGAKASGSELARVLEANWPGSEKAVNHVSMYITVSDACTSMRRSGGGGEGCPTSVHCCRRWADVPTWPMH